MNSSCVAAGSAGVEGVFGRKDSREVHDLPSYDDRGMTASCSLKEISFTFDPPVVSAVDFCDELGCGIDEL